MTRRRTALVLAIVLLLAGGGWLWASLDGIRADRQADEISDLPGVASVDVRQEEGSDSRSFEVAMSPGTGQSRLSEVLRRTSALVRGGPVTRGTVTLGKAHVPVETGVDGNPTKAERDRAARLAVVGRDLPRGTISVEPSGSVRVTVPRSKAWTAARDDLRHLMTARAPVKSYVVRTKADGTAGELLHVYVPGPKSVAVIERLLPISSEMSEVTVEGGSVGFWTSAPRTRLPTLMRTAQRAADAGGDRRGSVRMGSHGLELYGSDDPQRALRLVQDLESRGWTVRQVATDLSQLGIVLRGADAPSQSRLPGLDRYLRALRPALPTDARVSVGDDGGGIWGVFSGTPAQLHRHAATLARLADDGLNVRWGRHREGGPGVWVDLAPGKQVDDRTTLTAAFRAARSVPWSGVGTVRVRESADPDHPRRPRDEVTVTSKAAGRAGEIETGGKDAPAHRTVTRLWDATARTD